MIIVKEYNAEEKARLLEKTSSRIISLARRNGGWISTQAAEGTEVGLLSSRLDAKFISTLNPLETLSVCFRDGNDKAGVRPVLGYWVGDSAKNSSTMGKLTGRAQKIDLKDILGGGKLGYTIVFCEPRKLDAWKGYGRRVVAIKDRDHIYHAGGKDKIGDVREDRVTNRQGDPLITPKSDYHITELAIKRENLNAHHKVRAIGSGTIEGDSSVYMSTLIMDIGIFVKSDKLSRVRLSSSEKNSEVGLEIDAPYEPVHGKRTVNITHARGSTGQRTMISGSSFEFSIASPEIPVGSVTIGRAEYTYARKKEITEVETRNAEHKVISAFEATDGYVVSSISADSAQVAVTIQLAGKLSIIADTDDGNIKLLEESIRIEISPIPLFIKGETPEDVEKAMTELM